ncbi:MAG: TIM barrel protein [Candidatus ainarchaeum sp.]|nr:TIM barrel protein [Candidatus ainarchaeum sp.]
MPLIGLSSSYYAFRKFSVYDSVRRINELGFNTAELGAAHVFGDEIWAALKKIKKDFPETSFTVHGVFSPLKKNHWFNLSEGLTALNKKIFSDMFKAAEIVEAACVTVHPGYLSEAFFRHDETGMDCAKEGKPIPKEKALEGINESVGFASKLAKKTGVLFGMENVPLGIFRPAVYSPDDFNLLFKKFPKLGFLFDMGHALSEARLEEMLSLNEKTIEMHVHYSRQKSEKIKLDEHDPLPSEESVAFMKKIPQIKKIPLIFEHSTNISERQILAEKALLENFLKKL